MVSRTVIITFDTGDTTCYHATFQRHYNRHGYVVANRAGCLAVCESYSAWLLSHALCGRVRSKAPWFGRSRVIKFVFATGWQAAKAKLLLCGREFAPKF